MPAQRKARLRLRNAAQKLRTQKLRPAIQSRLAPMSIASTAPVRGYGRLPPAPHASSVATPAIACQGHASQSCTPRLAQRLGTMRATSTQMRGIQHACLTGWHRLVACPVPLRHDAVSQGSNMPDYGYPYGNLHALQLGARGLTRGRHAIPLDRQLRTGAGMPAAKTSSIRLTMKSMVSLRVYCCCAVCQNKATSATAITMRRMKMVESSN